MLMLAQNEIVVDNFAGFGGASLGLFQATGRSPEHAINHWRDGIGVHALNHGETEHHVTDVWLAKPRDLAMGRQVGIAWFSPDCTHFSKAKGAKPKSRKIRALAGVVNRWAKQVRPRVIVVENVEEFMTWGPLDAEGQPIKEKAGCYYRAWFRHLTEKLGYRGAYRILCAADYGAPTTRTRIFFVFRCDGVDPRFPEPTHGDARARAKNPDLLPWRAAAECINFSLPCPSIFMTRDEVKQAGLKIRRPLADNTLARIARGFTRHVAENPDPFVVDGQSYQPKGAPILVQTGYGERKATAKCRAQKTRVLDLMQPLGTNVACGVKHGVAVAYLVKNNGGHEGHGQGCDEPAAAITTRDSKSLTLAHLVKLRGTSTSSDIAQPAHTITASGTHQGTAAYTLIPADSIGEGELDGARRVFHFLSKYNGTQQYPDITGPAPTVTTVEGVALVQVVCVTLADGCYIVVDIGFRMLTPRELANCQGFPADYDIGEGRLSAEDQVRGIGNSVCPQVARAIVEANVGSWTGHLRSRTSRGTQLDVTLGNMTGAEAN